MCQITVADWVEASFSELSTLPAAGSGAAAAHACTHTQTSGVGGIWNCDQTFFRRCVCTHMHVCPGFHTTMPPGLAPSTSPYSSSFTLCACVRACVCASVLEPQYHFVCSASGLFYLSLTQIFCSDSLSIGNFRRVACRREEKNQSIYKYVYMNDTKL